MPKICFLFCYALSTVLILYGTLSCAFVTSRFGSILIGLFGILLLVATRFYPQIQRLRVHPICNALSLLCIAITCVLLLSFIATSVVITQAAKTTPDVHQDAIIVLGAGLRGEEVSLSLAKRLDIAYAYYRDNPEAVFLVSGGQGENEVISEAQAMKHYLVDTYGMPEDSIIMEDASTRTLENFTYSKAILDDIFERDYSVVYVTNDFHVFRSGKIATVAGLDAQGLSAPSAKYLLPNFYVREYFALIKFYLLDAM